MMEVTESTPLLLLINQINFWYCAIGLCLLVFGRYTLPKGLSIRGVEIYGVPARTRGRGQFYTDVFYRRPQTTKFSVLFQIIVLLFSLQVEIVFL